MSTPVQVVVAAFPNEEAAGNAMAELKRASKEGTIKIDNAATLVKDQNGKLHIKDLHDMGGGKGAAIGGVLGGVVGILAGPVGWAALGGAALGGLAAKMADGGFNDARLKKLGEGLTPGSSAIVAVVEHTWVDEVQAAMAEAGADMVTEEISADIATQLAAGGSVAYTAVASDAGVATARVAGDDKHVEVTAMAADEAGVTYMAAEGWAEEDGAKSGDAALPESPAEPAPANPETPPAS
jgi:uncharacterized membrane protein